MISPAVDQRMSIVSGKDFMKFTVDVVYVSRTPSAEWGSYHGTVYDVIHRIPPPPTTESFLSLSQDHMDDVTAQDVTGTLGGSGGGLLGGTLAPAPRGASSALVVSRWLTLCCSAARPTATPVSLARPRAHVACLHTRLRPWVPLLVLLISG